MFDDYDERVANEFSDKIFELSKEFTENVELREQIAVELKATLYCKYGSLQNMDDMEALRFINEYVRINFNNMI